MGKLLISSAPARKDTKLAIMACSATGKLFELYGSTEAGWVTVLRPDEQIEQPGLGGARMSGSGAIRLLDHAGKRGARWRSRGTVLAHRIRVRRLLEDPGKTAEAMRGEWCSVGDMARRDEEGYIYLVDRKSNMIISGGENVYPSEVEAVLAAHSAVQDVAVVGVPDEKWGESVLAVVVLRDATGGRGRDILDWCRERLAGYKRPK